MVTTGQEINAAAYFVVNWLSENYNINLVSLEPKRAEPPLQHLLCSPVTSFHWHVWSALRSSLCTAVTSFSSPTCSPVSHSPVTPCSRRYLPDCCIIHVQHVGACVPATLWPVYVLWLTVLNYHHSNHWNVPARSESAFVWIQPFCCLHSVLWFYAKMKQLLCKMSKLTK